MPLYALADVAPDVHPDAFVHPDATVIGDVSIGPESTVWPQAVLRGDFGKIVIGARTSIQDGSVIHTFPELPTLVGDDCVIGHLVHLEGCTVQDRALVGNGSIVMLRAVIESHSIVGAGAVVPNGMTVPSYAMALGIPAKLREGVVEEGEIERIAAPYIANGYRYRAELRRID